MIGNLADIHLSFPSLPFLSFRHFGSRYISLASKGDSELDGTGIETSVTGRFKISVIKQADFEPWQEALDFPLGETSDEYIIHGFTETDYLATFPDDPSQIYGASSIDKAMMNAYTQTRK